MKSFLKKTSGSLLFLIGTCSLAAQINPPTVEWQNETWLTKGTTGNWIPQKSYQEDWWYDHCSAYQTPPKGGSFSGYIAAGYSDLQEGIKETSSAFPAASTYGPGCAFSTYPAPLTPIDSSAGVDCGEWDIPGILPDGGAPRGTYGLISPTGTATWIKFTNFNGYYNRVKQLSDGNFLAVGTSAATRKSAAAPFNGMPLYFNASTDYFKYSTVYTSAYPYNSSNINKQHIDIIKFDINGNQIFNYLYGPYDISGTATINSLSGASLAYAANGEAFDFTQDASGNIIVVGNAIDETNQQDRAFILKISASGALVTRKFIGSTTHGSNARAVEVVNNGSAINYIIAYQDFQGGSSGTQTIITELDQNLNIIWSTQIPNSSGNSNCWDLAINANNYIVAPVLTNCNNCQWADDNQASLRVYLLNLSGTVLNIPPVLSAVEAFDLKARLCNLSSGSGTDFGIISSMKPANWAYGCARPSWEQTTSTCNYEFASGYWNTNAYVARIDLNGNKIWDTNFDSGDAMSCNFPAAISDPGYPNAGDNVKRQECMYGISEAPDGGIVVSGNSSNNFDDDYMTKLSYGGCGYTPSYDITGTGNIINITTNTTWNSSHKVLGSVHVKSGKTLTITGSTTLIEFADSRTTGITTNIYVEAGGVLNITGGATLDALQSCSIAMWDGIILQGQTSQLTQATANQPTANVNTASKIQNARTAFLVGDNTTNPYNGGILKVTDSYFYNNNIDVQFSPYTAPGTTEPNNSSSFTNSSFISNRFLNDTITYPVSSTNKHIVLNQVKGIQVNGCAFYADPSVIGLSYGIYSTDATFTVQRRCNITGPTGACGGNSSSFTNLQYGIYAQSSNSLKNFTVNQNIFTNCSGSIYQSGINYSTVTSNTFAINTAIPPVTNHLCSVNHNCVNWFHYINNCNGFTHQENVHTVTGTTQTVLGAVFNGTSTSASSTYKNTYSGLYQSNQIQGNNASLQIQCNQSTSTKFADIYVSSGSFPTQGTCVNQQSTANNTFSRPNFSSTSDINDAGTTPFAYNYNPTPSTGSQVPTYKTSNVSVNGCGGFVTFNYASACPSKLGGGSSGSSRVADNNNPVVLAQPMSLINNIGQSSKDVLAYYALQAQYTLDQAITGLLNDSVKPSTDSLLLILLKTDTTEKGKTDLVYFYLGKKDYVNAQIYINIVKTLPGCDKKGVFLQHCKDLIQQNRTWQDINTNTSLRNDLFDFAYDSLSNGFGNARSVLAIIKNTHNYEYVEPAIGSGMANNARAADAKNVQIILNANNILLNAYPNPFKDDLTVSFCLPENTQDAKIQIIEPASGKILLEKPLAANQQQQVLDTKELGTGLYLIEIKASNIRTQFIKITTFK